MFNRWHNPGVCVVRIRCTCSPLIVTKLVCECVAAVLCIHDDPFDVEHCGYVVNVILNIKVQNDVFEDRCWM